jgi:hypothetical protein
VNWGRGGELGGEVSGVVRRNPHKEADAKHKSGTRKKSKQEEEKKKKKKKKKRRRRKREEGRRRKEAITRARDDEFAEPIVRGMI